jgi:hypothetical protein
MDQNGKGGSLDRFNSDSSAAEEESPKRMRPVAWPFASKKLAIALPGW